jgi:hypothetical protein
MQVNVTLSFASVDEMLAHFGSTKLVRVSKVDAPATGKGHALLETAADGPAPVEFKIEAPAQPKARPGRPRKVAADDIVVEKAQVAPLDVAKGDELPPAMQADPEPAPAAEPPKTYTLDDAKNAMKAFSEKYGIDALRAKLVETVGAARISDVPPEKYGTLIDQMTKDLAP